MLEDPYSRRFSPTSMWFGRAAGSADSGIAAICDLRQEVNSGGFDSYFRYWGGDSAPWRLQDPRHLRRHRADPAAGNQPGHLGPADRVARPALPPSPGDCGYSSNVWQGSPPQASSIVPSAPMKSATMSSASGTSLSLPCGSLPARGGVLVDGGEGVPKSHMT